MKATIAWLRDDTKDYEAAKAKAFAINPAYAELYRIVARSAVREHRYVEAIELEKQAIKLKPDFYEAMAGAGLGYLRLGMEKEGLEWLDKACEGRPVQRPHRTTRSTCSSRRSRRSTRSRRRRTSRSATTTTRRRRSRATSSRRWSARSPTWCGATASRRRRRSTLELYADKQRLRGAHRRAARHRRARRVLRPGDHGDVAGERRHQLGHGAVARARPRVRDPAVELARAALVHRGAQRVRDADRAARLAARERRRPLRRGREQHAAVDRRPQLRVHAARSATRSSSRTSSRR